MAAYIYNIPSTSEKKKKKERNMKLSRMEEKSKFDIRHKFSGHYVTIASKHTWGLRLPVVEM